jgi:hypothetical protein
MAQADIIDTKAYTNIHPFSGGMSTLLRRYHLSTKIAAVVDMIVAINVVPTISAGLIELKFIRMAIRVVGIRVILDVFNASSVHIAVLALSLSGLSFCSSCMALMPIGVAALPRPRMFALILDMMYPSAG